MLFIRTFSALKADELFFKAESLSIKAESLSIKAERLSIKAERLYSSLGFESEQEKGNDSKVDIKNSHALNQFLSGAEKRAYRIAQISTNNADDAFDIVQDAMFKLVEKYSHKPSEEWGALFHRILQSRILDWHRRTKVRNRFRVWFGTSAKEDKDGLNEDYIQIAKDPAGRTPEQELEADTSIEVLEEVLKTLSLRQQQTFLLRAWEGLSVKQTAQAMSCSEGSVKTHYSRAIHSLRGQLGEHWA